MMNNQNLNNFSAEKYNIHKACKGKNKYKLFGSFISSCEGDNTLVACMGIHRECTMAEFLLLSSCRSLIIACK